MYIWHEDIIPKLCDTHLQRVWKNAWIVYRTIIKRRTLSPSSKAAKEFVVGELHLLYRMDVIYKEGRKRGIHFKKQPPSIFSVTDTPFTQFLKEMRLYQPHKSIEQQLELLRKESCDCRKIYAQF